MAMALFIMNKPYTFLKLIGSLLLALLLSFCSKEDEDPEAGIPSNLVIKIDSIDHQTGYTVIDATANNTIYYQLYVNPIEDVIDENTTGDFTYTFESEGDHEIEIRAYGSSGKYLRATKSITISPGTDPDPIPVDSGYFSAEEYDGFERVWEDEFSNNSINTAFWNFDIGNGCPNLCGWGNNELEYYKQENAWISDGVLVIEARNEYFNGYNYTSARLNSKGKKSFQYGRVDIRALLPVGQGMWPALWMLGNNISSVGWPKCGEIDIMEMIGGSGRENTVYGTIHWDNGAHASTGDSKTLSQGTFATEYHVFSIVWDENQISFYVNDQKYYETLITSSDMSEFHQEFYFILNLAVGGNWPGSPDETTTFNQQMRVDYIRVFQKD